MKCVLCRIEQWNGPRIDKTVLCLKHARELKYSCWIMIVVAWYCVYIRNVFRLYIQLAHTWRRWRTVCCSHSRSPMCAECVCEYTLVDPWITHHYAKRANAHTICRLIEEVKNQSGKKRLFCFWLRGLPSNCNHLLAATTKTSKEVETHTKTPNKSAYACTHVLRTCPWYRTHRFARLLLNFCGEYFKRSNRNKKKKSWKRLTNVDKHASLLFHFGIILFVFFLLLVSKWKRAQTHSHMKPHFVHVFPFQFYFISTTMLDRIIFKINIWVSKRSVFIHRTTVLETIFLFHCFNWNSEIFIFAIFHFFFFL